MKEYYKNWCNAYGFAPYESFVDYVNNYTTKKIETIDDIVNRLNAHDGDLNASEYLR